MPETQALSIPLAISPASRYTVLPVLTNSYHAVYDSEVCVWGEGGTRMRNEECSLVVTCVSYVESIGSFSGITKIKTKYYQKDTTGVRVLPFNAANPDLIQVGTSSWSQQALLEVTPIYLQDKAE